MLLKLSTKFFRKNILSNIILILQLTVSFLLMNLIVGNLNFIDSAEDNYNKLNIKNFIYVMPMNIGTNVDFLYECVGVESINSIDQYLLFDSQNEVQLFAYDNNLLSVYAEENAFEINSDIIPVIASVGNNNYKKGEIISLVNYDGNVIKCQIIDLIQNPAYILDFNTSSNLLSPADLFRIHDKYYESATIFLTAKDLMNTINVSKVGSQLCSLVTLTNDISVDDIESIKSVLTENGINLIDNEQIAINGQDNHKRIIERIAPYTICGFVLSLIGFISIIVLNTMRRMPTIAILNVSGVKWKSCILICLISSLIIASIPLILLILIYFILDNVLPVSYRGILIMSNNIILTLIIYIFFIFISIIIPSLYFRYKNPIQIYKMIGHNN